MITATFARGHVVIEGRIPEGATVFVDADWLPDSGDAGEITALLVTNDSLTETHSGRSVRFMGDERLAAETALVAVAHEAAAVVAALNGATEVLGSGALAALTRARLREHDTQHPEAIIDASGSMAAITDALARLPELGTLVLAGEMGERECELDVYRDLHLRGINVVGVGTLCTGPLEDPADSTLLPAPTAVVVGQPFLNEALWYRVER